MCLRDLIPHALIASAAALLLGPAAPASAGSATALPRFSDGSSSVLISEVTGVIKRHRLETQFACTSIAPEAINVGVEVFDSSGFLQNDVGADVGAVTDIPPGATVTIATGTTAAFLETKIIPLAEIEQGAARILASRPEVRCRVWIVDELSAPPVAIGELKPAVSPVPAGAGQILPVFGNGARSTHFLVVPGVAKRGRVETDFFCTSRARELVHIGVEIFGPDGQRRNAIDQGTGALLNVASGRTVTIGTTGTTAFLEDTVIPMEGVAQGHARIVTTSGEVICAAMLVESDLDPPVGLTGLPLYSLGRTIPSPTPTRTQPPTATFTRPTSTPTLTRTPRPTPTPIVGCTGDCNDDGAIRVSELVVGVRISLGLAELESCDPFDVNGDGMLVISELIRAVNAALDGCVPD